MRKQTKYRSVWTEVDGIKFQSKKEARRYTVLNLMEKQGYINNLRRQVPYELNEGGSFSYVYKADFVYEQSDVTYVEDSKGFITREFRKKMKLMKSIYNIDIKLS